MWCHMAVESLAVLAVEFGYGRRVAAVRGVRFRFVEQLLELQIRRHVAGCQWRVSVELDLAEAEMEIERCEGRLAENR